MGNVISSQLLPALIVNNKPPLHQVPITSHHSKTTGGGGDLCLKNTHFPRLQSQPIMSHPSVASEQSLTSESYLVQLLYSLACTHLLLFSVLYLSRRPISGNNAVLNDSQPRYQVCGFICVPFMTVSHI